MATLEQKIAQKQDELARLKEKARKLENGQKIIIGGMMLSIAESNPQIAKYLLDEISKNVTRDADKKRLESVMKDLREWSNKNPQGQYNQ